MCQAARDWTSLAPGKRGSRPMADKWPDLLRARSWQDLPPRIYVALVGQLFGTPAFISLLEVLLIATIGGMASLRSGDPWLRSEEHTSELTSLMRISHDCFCLKK